MKKQINSQTIIITLDLLKNVETLIKRLESSLNLQKQFLSEIDNKLTSFLNNKSKNKNDILLIDQLLKILPKIINQLGIPFVYYFFKQEKLLEKFVNLYYDKYEKEIGDIYETCLNISSFSLYYDYFNKLKHYLIDIGIIQNKEQYANKNIPMNPEEMLFENISSILNELTQLKNIGIDKENIHKLENDYKDILKEIKNLPTKMVITRAQIEFYQELIKPFGDYLKSMNKNINKDIIVREDEKFIDTQLNKNNNLNKEVMSVVNIPLDKRTFFYQNEKIKETRNKFIEFKNYRIPLSQEKGEEIKKELCSFLNSQGGRLYIGIDEQNIVKGIELNYKKRDNLRNSLINLTFDFYPKCRLDKIFVYFIPIKDPYSNNFVKKKYVIKIRVYPGDPEVLYSMSNKGGYHSTIRRNGQCVELNSTEIYNEIIERDELKNIQNNNNHVIKENDIKDPEPEINQQDLENDDDDYEDIPAFGINNLNNIKQIIKEKGQKKNYGKPKKIIKNMVREGTITIKVTNIDENIPVNEINRFFNGCKCATQKFFKSGYGYLNFSSLNDANNCIVNYDGIKLGNKKIKLNIVNNEKI